MIDNANQTSPTLDSFDPSLIAGDVYDVKTLSGFDAFRFIRAPTAGTDPYYLVVKCASRWKNTPPGGTFNPVTGYTTWTFDPGDKMRDVQVLQIIKAGSTAGLWQVAP